MENSDINNLKAIISAFGDDEYIYTDDLLNNRIVNCGEKELFSLLSKLKKGKFIQFVKGSIAESEYNLPIEIRQTDKLREDFFLWDFNKQRIPRLS